MHQIVEDILAAQQREHEFDLYVKEEMENLPACEGPLHPTGGNGHNPDEPAAFMVIPPCGRDSLRCASYVADLLTWDMITCTHGGCGDTHLVRDLALIPLEMD